MFRWQLPTIVTSEFLGVGYLFSNPAFPLRTLRPAFLSTPVACTVDPGLAPEGRCRQTADSAFLAIAGCAIAQPIDCYETRVLNWCVVGFEMGSGSI
jgi:hypothetical protein